QNLVLNMNDHGYKVGVYNRTTEVTREFVAGAAAGTQVVGFETLADLVAGLATPRRVMLMVKAGKPVDQVIASLEPLLEPGDIIIDGGNSHFNDTTRRTSELRAKGLRFIGTGVSGGEEGARTGPSIMPGGDIEAWPYVKEIFQSIAAQVDGIPCCDWVGEDGAGHYVKMVHNGIEYGDMQLISESYALMSEVLGLDAKAMSAEFAGWNRGRPEGYRQVDVGRRPRARRAVDAHHRGRLLALPLIAQRPAGAGRAGADGTGGSGASSRPRFRGAPRRRLVRVQDHLLRSGLPA